MIAFYYKKSRGLQKNVSPLTRKRLMMRGATFLIIRHDLRLIVCRKADNLKAVNQLGNSIPFCLSDTIRCAFLRLSVPPNRG